jgi:hypothetical protein
MIDQREYSNDYRSIIRQKAFYHRFHGEGQPSPFSCATH